MVRISVYVGKIERTEGGVKGSKAVCFKYVWQVFISFRFFLSFRCVWWSIREMETSMGSEKTQPEREKED